VSFQSVTDDDVADVSLPSMQGTAEDEALDALSALTVNDTPADVFSTPPQLDGELITLTLLPRSRWQTLLNLEVIQQRNKPKDPLKAVEQAPFFLPTLPGVDARFVVEPKNDGKQTKQKTRRLDKAAAESESIFYQKLVADDAEGDYENLFGYAKTLSPAAIDLELRSLVALDSLRLFLNALARRLVSHRDFEAVQTFLNVLLHMHADVIVENAELREDLVRLNEIQQRESERVLELIASSLGTLGFVRDNIL
jgi:U3 small nucleolar RNA-associated protein 21